MIINSQETPKPDEGIHYIILIGRFSVTDQKNCFYSSSEFKML